MKLRRKIITIFAILFLSFLFLQAQETIKLGVVDSQKILFNSNRGKEVLAQLDRKTKEMQSKLDKMDKEIQELENKIATQRIALQPEILDKLGEDLQKKRTERQRFLEDSQREIMNLRNRLFTKMRNEILPIIQEIGKEKGYTLIVDLGDAGAIYWNPAIDITDEVIKRYNLKYSKQKSSKK